MKTEHHFQVTLVDYPSVKRNFSFTTEAGFDVFYHAAAKAVKELGFYSFEQNDTILLLVKKLSLENGSIIEDEKRVRVSLEYKDFEKERESLLSSLQPICRNFIETIVEELKTTRLIVFPKTSKDRKTELDRIERYATELVALLRELQK